MMTNESNITNRCEGIEDVIEENDDVNEALVVSTVNPVQDVTAIMVNRDARVCSLPSTTIINACPHEIDLAEVGKIPMSGIVLRAESKPGSCVRAMVPTITEPDYGKPDDMPSWLAEQLGRGWIVVIVSFVYLEACRKHGVDPKIISALRTCGPRDRATGVVSALVCPHEALRAPVL